MVLLQPFAREDIARLVYWIRTADALVQWAGNRFQFPFTEAQYEDHFLESQGAEPSALIYKIICRSRLKVIGHIELERIDYIEKTAYLARLLIGDEEDRDRGYGSAAMERVLEIAFSNLKLRQVNTDVLIFNLPAIQCCNKCGFETVRTRNNSIRLSDKLWSEHHMQLESKLWMRRSQGLE